MTLLEALIQLVKASEGRRSEIRELYAAVGRVAETLGAELRDGDAVEIEGRRIHAVSIQRGDERVKTLALDGRVLGAKTTEAGVPWVSLAETRWFAQHAKDVFTALLRQLQRDKRRLRADRKLVTGHSAQEGD